MKTIFTILILLVFCRADNLTNRLQILKGFFKANGLIEDVEAFAISNCFATINNQGSVLSDQFNPSFFKSGRFFFQKRLSKDQIKEFIVRLVDNLDLMAQQCQEVTTKGVKLIRRMQKLSAGQVFQIIRNNIMGFFRLYKIGNYHYSNHKYYEAGLTYGAILSRIIGDDNSGDNDSSVSKVMDKDDININDKFYKSIDLTKYLLIAMTQSMKDMGLDNDDDPCLDAKYVLANDVNNKLETVNLDSIQNYLSNVKTSLLNVFDSCITDTNHQVDGVSWVMNFNKKYHFDTYLHVLFNNMDSLFQYKGEFDQVIKAYNESNERNYFRFSKMLEIMDEIQYRLNDQMIGELNKYERIYYGGDE